MWEYQTHGLDSSILMKASLNCLGPTRRVPLLQMPAGIWLPDSSSEGPREERKRTKRMNKGLSFSGANQGLNRLYIIPFKSAVSYKDSYGGRTFVAALLFI